MKRRNPGVKGFRPDLKEMRREEAVARNSAWAALTLEQQLQILNTKFPDGCVRQKGRIIARMAELQANAEAQQAAEAARTAAKAAKREKREAQK